MSNSRVLFLATLVLVAPRISSGVAVGLGSVFFWLACSVSFWSCVRHGTNDHTKIPSAA